MASLVDRFRAHVERAGLFPKPGTAIVAVSGGADSVALLDLLHGGGQAGVAAAHGLSLVVAHADHQIQEGSAEVAMWVRRLAEQDGLPFELGELRLGPGATETAARRARYAWLGEVKRCHGARYLVTAHHQDDQVETVLLRVLKGSAPAGLAGMAATGRGGIVRPLLPFSKLELTAHVAQRGLAAYEDPANRDPRHLRSWIRVRLLPLLSERLGPRVPADLLRVGRAAAAERRAWDHVLELVPELELHVARHRFAVARACLARYDNTLSVALLRAAARQAGMVLGPVRARRLVEFAAPPRPSGRRLSLGGGWVAEVAFDRVSVFRTVGRAADRAVPTGERGSAAFGSYVLSWRPEPAPSAVERAGWTTWVTGSGWEVRAPRLGDKLKPLGGVGRRPLRRLLMEARVPRSERAQYPVVARGETVLWVPGICRSGADLPQPGTPAVRLDVTEYAEPEADRRA